MRKMIILAAILALAAAGQGQILNVPADYNTIQAAVDDAVDGDEIILADGVYTGSGGYISIDVTNKGIRIESQNGPDNCIIDCNGATGVYLSISDPNKHPVVSGLTVVNAAYYGFYLNNNRNDNLSTITVQNCIVRSCNYAGIRVYGGPQNCLVRNCLIENCRLSGIYSLNQGCLVEDCIIRNNSSSRGGGIYGRGFETTIRNCLIENNYALGDGGGIYLEENGVVENCRILNNRCDSSGGGIYCNRTETVIKNCIIAFNTASNAGGINAIYETKISNSVIAYNTATNYWGGINNDYKCVELAHSIIWKNSDSGGSGLSAQLSNTETDGNGDDDHRMIYNCCISDGIPGDGNIPAMNEDNDNIDDDPMFVREPDDGGDGWGNGNDDYGDFHLQPGSPCIEAGIKISPFSGDVDMDGQPRLAGKFVDIGADEYQFLARVEAPAGGEVWLAGSTHTIRWQAWGVNQVDLLFRDNIADVCEIIAADVNNSGEFQWTIPDGLDINDCSILIRSPYDANVFCNDSPSFSIEPYPWPRAISPWWRANNHRLSWWTRQRFTGPQYGCVKWQFRTDGPLSTGAVITPFEKIYIACEDGKLYKLDIEGNLEWVFDANSPIYATPAIGYHRKVFFATEDGWLYAIKSDGSLLWRNQLGAAVYGSPVVADDAKVIITASDGRVYAFDHDGSELWTFQLRDFDPLSSVGFESPVIKDNVAYVPGGYDPNLYAVDINTGEVLWSCDFMFDVNTADPNFDNWMPYLSGVPVYTPYITDDNTIYQSILYDSNLYAIDANTGTIDWSIDLVGYLIRTAGFRYWYSGACYFWCDPGQPIPPGYGHPWDQYKRLQFEFCLDSPVVGPDGTVYVSFDDGYIRAVNPDGSLKWLRRCGIVGAFTMTVSENNLLYVSADDGEMCVFDANGNELSRFKGAGALSEPTLTPYGFMLVSDANNTLWAISPNDCNGHYDLHHPADFDGDSYVEFPEMITIANDWLETPIQYPFTSSEHLEYGTILSLYPAGDVDRDLWVNLNDFALIAEQWLKED